MFLAVEDSDIFVAHSSTMGKSATQIWAVENGGIKSSEIYAVIFDNSKIINFNTHN